MRAITVFAHACVRVCSRAAGADRALQAVCNIGNQQVRGSVARAVQKVTNTIAYNVRVRADEPKKLRLRSPSTSAR